jgi:hypothetical protein
MSVTLFKDTTYNLTNLVDNIKRGEIALPDIQRPFVWPASKVRDLFDSMYKGFPVGYLLFWYTGSAAHRRRPAATHVPVRGPDRDADRGEGLLPRSHPDRVPPGRCEV